MKHLVLINSIALATFYTLALLGVMYAILSDEVQKSEREKLREEQLNRDWEEYFED